MASTVVKERRPISIYIHNTPPPLYKTRHFQDNCTKTMVVAQLMCLGAPLLRTSYEEIVDRHISTIMPLFLADELSHEWNPRLKAMNFVHTREFGRVVHQEYAMPWPLAPRDLLMHCKRTIHRRETRLISGCHSVRHAGTTSRPGVVRMELASSEWDVVALPGDRTRLKLSMAVRPDMAAGVPKFVVNYAQRSMLRDSISSIMAAVDRLQLPPHHDFLSWRRSHAEVAMALAGSGSGGGWWWPVAMFSALVLALVHSSVLGLLYAACRVRAKRESDPPARMLRCDKPQWRRTRSLACAFVASALRQHRPAEVCTPEAPERARVGTTQACAATAATGPAA